MTNEDAAALVADVFEQLEYERGTGDSWSEEHEARDMAIEALLSNSEKPNRRKKWATQKQRGRPRNEATRKTAAASS